MGGLFAAASKNDCMENLFFGTDYHCHLGTRRGGMAVLNAEGFTRFIHDITNAQFKSKFESDLEKMSGRMGIGVISDYEDQPLIIGSHLGVYAIATVGKVNNKDELATEAFDKRNVHFSEMSGHEINQTELISMLINREESFEAGIRMAQDAVDGSCTLVLLTEKGIYAARDKLGRTPLILGKGADGYAVTMETSAFPNIGYEIVRDLGPGEILLFTADGFEQRIPPGEKMQICGFLWVYYGFPASSYESINVEAFRYRNGASLASKDNVDIDYVAGIPDSGTAYAVGYSNHTRIPYARPFVKYTPTWARSFMPQNQSIRDLVARMKLLPVRSLTQYKRLLFCDDSIVRGTQLKDILQRIYEYGAREIHMRIACPPLIYGCRYLNFSRSRSDMDLAARKAINELEPGVADVSRDYSDPESERYREMVERIAKILGLTTLQYQTLGDMINAIGLSREKICTHCWTGPQEQLSLSFGG